MESVSSKNLGDICAVFCYFSNRWTTSNISRENNRGSICIDYRSHLWKSNSSAGNPGNSCKSRSRLTTLPLLRPVLPRRWRNLQALNSVRNTPGPLKSGRTRGSGSCRFCSSLRQPARSSTPRIRLSRLTMSCVKPLVTGCSSPMMSPH